MRHASIMSLLPISFLCYDTLLLQPNTQAFEHTSNDCMNRKAFQSRIHTVHVDDLALVGLCTDDGRIHTDFLNGMGKVFFFRFPEQPVIG